MDNPETLYFNGDWKPVYNPVEFKSVEDTPDEAGETVPKKKERGSKPLLVIIQIIVCIIGILSLYGLKYFKPDMFSEVYKWYDKNINNELIIKEDVENISLDKLINAIQNK